MKKIIWSIVLLGMVMSSYAQAPFKVELANDSKFTVEISLSNDEIIIVGTDANTLTIESIGKESPNYGKKIVEEKKPEKVPERASGLKPISKQAPDNTGLGINYSRMDDYVNLSSKAVLASDQYKITIPNNVKLIINDMPLYGKSDSDYSLSGFKNEVIVTSLNSNFKITNQSGPLVFNSTNGNAEIIYSAIKGEKPISIVTVNGFVDLTLPSSTKANVQFHSINGEAYTDFDIESEEETANMSLPGMDMFILNGKINGGGRDINIQSVNGDIYLRKGKG